MSDNTGAIMRPLIIYHAGCADGFGAAYAAWKTYGDHGADYQPVAYGAEPPDVTGREVYMIDISWPRKEMTKMKRKAASLLVLDHHETAEKELQGLKYAKFDMSKSEAIMAWEYFHPEERVPNFLLYIQDRDLWKWEMAFSREVGLALNSYPNEFEAWDTFNDPRAVETLIEEGKVISRYAQQQCNRLEKNAQMGYIGEHKIPIVNTAIYQSEMGNHFAKHHPFSATFYVNKEGKYVWSLRSFKDDPEAVHVGELALQLVKAGLADSGGGHRNAAGFITSKQLDMSKPHKLKSVEDDDKKEEK